MSQVKSTTFHSDKVIEKSILDPCKGNNQSNSKNENEIEIIPSKEHI